MDTHKPLDALLLCGDRGANRPVMGESKVFLYLHGKPLFMYPLEALLASPAIGRVFIVGNKARLDQSLAQMKAPPEKPVVTIEQKANLLANAWEGFLYTLDGYGPGDEERRPDLRNKVVFILPGDAPLISQEDIDDFLGKADMDKYDHVIGFSTREAMSGYYPSGGRPGIKMAYIHMREGAFRINNLHLARPFACANRQAIQLMYNSRYQKDVRNIIRLSRDMWAHHVKLQSLALYFMMQLSLFSAHLGLNRLRDFFRRRAPIGAVAASVGRILGMRVGYVITDRCGAALDIDNERDYETMKLRFWEWKQGSGSARA